MENSSLLYLGFYFCSVLFGHHDQSNYWDLGTWVADSLAKPSKTLEKSAESYRNTRQNYTTLCKTAIFQLINQIYQGGQNDQALYISEG